MTPEAPYASPKAELTEPESTKYGSQVKAVLVGVVVDLIGTIVVALLVSALYGVILALRGLSPDEIELLIQNSSPISPLNLTLFALGAGMSVLGGYLCARIAKRREYFLALLTGVLSVAFPAAVTVMQEGIDLKLVLMMLFTLCASLLGGHIAFNRNNQGS
jgi:hypothetical protein